MSKTRATLRLEIKELLREFAEVDTVGSGGIDSSSTTLPVTTIGRYAVGDLLYIESEIMVVRLIDAENEELTVTRGFQLSTAAAHSAAVAIQIVAEYTDRALNQCIDYGIADTWPEIYFERLDTTLTTSTATREYSLPSGFSVRSIISIIEVQDGDGNYQINKKWKILGGMASGGTSNRKIVFNEDFSDDGLTIRVTGQDYQTALTTDASTLSLSDEQSHFIVYSAAKYAIEMRMAKRIKSTEYSAAVNDRAGQPDQMIGFLNYIKRRSQEIKFRESRQQMGGYLTVPKR